MAPSDSKSPDALGFLAIFGDRQHGLSGGYLLLNLAGRPLEFHCTAPIKANRAQQILFGPTLDSYLFGEQIGQTLWNKAQTRPLAVLVESTPAAALREFVDAPVAVVSQSMLAPSGWTSFQLGANCLHTPERRGADKTLIETALADLHETDLREPFERIRQAIDEAQKPSRAA